MEQKEYVFRRTDHEPELERLKLIEQICDPSTQRRMLATGLGRGWACLEVGPGAGSIMIWMAEVVGTEGRVVAVDLDPKFIEHITLPNVEVHRGDICTASLPQNAFHLIHTRYVLIHVHDPETALTRLIECLKPGGWLVLEEPDFSASRGITGDEKTLESVARVNQAIASMYHTLGMDHAVGVKLPAMVQRQGLRNLRAEYDAPLCTGGSGMATMMKRSAGQLRDKYLATGMVTVEDLARYERFAEDPQAWGIYYATVAVTGQRSS